MLNHTRIQENRIKIQWDIEKKQEELQSQTARMKLTSQKVNKNEDVECYVPDEVIR